MERPTIDEMRTVMRLRGFEWSDAELEAIRPAVEAGLKALASLDALPLESSDPIVQFRIV